MTDDQKPKLEKWREALRRQAELYARSAPQYRQWLSGYAKETLMDQLPEQCFYRCQLCNLTRRQEGNRKAAVVTEHHNSMLPDRLKFETTYLLLCPECYGGIR